MKFDIPQQPTRDPVVAFLDSVDPSLLEKEALEGLGWGDDSVTVAILKKLKEYANGRS